MNNDVEKKEVKDFMDKIDRTIPRRRIQRRHSMLNLGEVLENNQVEAQNAVLPAQNAVLPMPNENLPVGKPPKKRSASVDARMYLAPPEMQSTINLLRQKDGVLNYQSSFHSVHQKRARVVEIGTYSGLSTSTVDAVLDTTNDIGSENQVQSSNVRMENAGALTVSIVNPETMSQMEETLRQLRENLGKFIDPVFFLILEK